MEIVTHELSGLVGDPANPRTHDDKNIGSIMSSLDRHGQVEPLVVQKSSMMIIAGNGRAEAMRRLGWTEADVVLVDVDDVQARELSIKLNRTAELAGWDDKVLQQHLRALSTYGEGEIELTDFGFSDEDLGSLFESLDLPEDKEPEPELNQPEAKRVGGLVQDWGVPPFSVLDTRQGYWMARRRWWKGLGINSNIGKDHIVTTAGIVSSTYGSNRGDALGGSTFDPALCECLINWYSKIGDRIIDPFAGGSVRGVVSAILGREYVGVDIRQVQVSANQEQWDSVKEYIPQLPTPIEEQDYASEYTPVWYKNGRWYKRDDLFRIAGVAGGKVRTCWALAQGAKGLVTAGSRASPQVNIVAHIAKRLGIPCRVHTPAGEASPEVQQAVEYGAVRVEHKPGYNSVIIARARDDAKERGWTEIPFGMQCDEAIKQTRKQVFNLPKHIKRIVIPVGSGMSLSGMLWGLKDYKRDVPVLGVVVGADPSKRLDEFAPPNWKDMVELVDAGVDYHEAVDATVDNVLLDPHYEAKCAKFLKKGDLLWIVGIRATAETSGTFEKQPDPCWVVGDSCQIGDRESYLGDCDDFDMLLTCPPYGDLEVYSDDPKDISNMPYSEFIAAFNLIMTGAASRLKPGSFAAVVMGEIRSKEGPLHGLIPDTIEAMRQAGCQYYCDAILVNSAGSLPLRVGMQFRRSRKIGRMHQYVLIFTKGEPRTDMPSPKILNIGAQE